MDSTILNKPGCNHIFFSLLDPCPNSLIMTFIWNFLVDLQKRILHETELTSNCCRENSISEGGQLQYDNLTLKNIIEMYKYY